MVDELTAWAMENGPLPMPVEVIRAVEARGHTVELETGRIYLWGDLRPMADSRAVAASVALAIDNLVQAVEDEQAKVAQMEEAALALAEAAIEVARIIGRRGADAALARSAAQMMAAAQRVKALAPRGN